MAAYRPQRTGWLPQSSTARARRRRALAVMLGLVTVAAVLFAVTRGHGAPGKSQKTVTPASAAPAVATLQADLTSWRLPAPLSRAVVLPDEGRLDVLGGLQASNATTPSILQIDPQTGKSSTVGSLGQPVHDAAGAVLGSHLVVFGGGASTVTAAVQAYDGSSSSSTVSGRLPSPRADLVTVQAGNRVLIVGGYDGKRWTPDVLTTTDGTSFATLATLPTPVRYPAATVIGNTLYVIGGERTDGADSTDIQTVDLTTKRAAVSGHLSRGVSHAAAVTIGGTVYIAGGRSGNATVDTVSRFDPNGATLSPAGRLPVAVSDAGVAMLGDTAYLVGGETGTKPTATVITVRVVHAPTPASSALAGRPPFDGKLLIADRGNNRLLLVDQDRNILWQYPSPSAPAPPQGFYFPDDAFFVKNGSAILTNEEEQHTIIELSYPDGRVIASYGHPNVAGSAPGYLNQPDDAYLLKDGRVIVADAKNCRILELNPDFTFLRQIGTTGVCGKHNPPTYIAYPNGDTPLADGNVLVSEINGNYVDEIALDGSLIWSIKLPLSYVSDPQQLGPDLYLAADYAKPGGVYEFTREGRIVYAYAPASGDAMLDHPSLAEMLPSGLICVNDDYRHRVVLIDPKTSTIVWQYGMTDQAGTGPNQLNIPDGFDLIAPNGSTPTHSQTG